MNLAELQRREAEVTKKEAYWKHQESLIRVMNAQTEALVKTLQEVFDALANEFSDLNNMPPRLKPLIPKLGDVLRGEAAKSNIQNRQRVWIYVDKLMEVFESMHREWANYQPTTKKDLKTGRTHYEKHVDDILALAKDVANLIKITLDYKDPPPDVNGSTQIESPALQLGVHVRGENPSDRGSEQERGPVETEETTQPG